MMEDLFKNVDLDLNLDLRVNDSNELDFLPEDLFNFIDDDLREDLKEIAESDVIPNIERLINFDEDDQLVGDIQWNDGLDTTNFFKNVQMSSDQTAAEKNKLQSWTTYDENTSSTLPNSPTTTYLMESSSSDSTDFLDMFQNYYILDSNNQFISHPIKSLSIEDMHKLTNLYNQNGQTHSFDLSNNFGGFANVQSALNLVNGASSTAKLINTAKPTIKRKQSKGTSLLANKPKSYRTIKKEMSQRNFSRPQLNNYKTKVKSSSISLIGKCRLSETSISIININDEQPLNKRLHITTPYAQDHDYCLATLDDLSHF